MVASPHQRAQAFSLYIEWASFCFPCAPAPFARPLPPAAGQAARSASEMVWRWTLIKALRPYLNAELKHFKCATG